MDRRKLIIGSGAAAVATTLGAVTGAGSAYAGSARAAAVRARLLAIATADHARLILDEVKAELGLVDPDGVQRTYDERYEIALAAPVTEPKPGDMETWIKQRLKELCGTDSYAEAGKIPEARTLIAFAFLAYSQNQKQPLPDIDPRAAVPPVFEKLEPDFLPVLLALINEKSRASREFASALAATSALIDKMVAEKVKQWPGKDGKDGKAAKLAMVQAQANPTPGQAAEFALGMAVMICFFYYIKRELKL